MSDKINIEFESHLFRPFLPEESQVNPQVYGAELAYWLSKQLAELQVITTYPISEDWGWFIEYLRNDKEYWVCCRNCDELPHKWWISIEPRSKSFFGRSKASMTDAEPLIKALHRLLDNNPDISNVTWC